MGEAYQREEGQKSEVAQALDRSRDQERFLEAQPLNQQPARRSFLPLDSEELGKPKSANAGNYQELKRGP